MTARFPRESWRRLGSLLFVAVLVLLAVVYRRPLGAWFGVAGAPSAAPSGHAESDAIDHYTCSMHPSVKQAGPGKCPICGMTLVPVTKVQQQQGVVTIDEPRRQLIGVRIGTVVEGPMRKSFHAVGRVAYDESKLTDVTLKVPGFVAKLFVNQTGQRVKAGQILLSLFSPELFAAEQDFLLVTQAGVAPAAVKGPAESRGELLARAGRQRLHLLGLSDAQIDAVAKSGTPSESIAIASPASGFVIEKNVVQGDAVEAGMRLFRIAALDHVWVEAEVYEADLAHVHVGDGATVTLDYVPGRSYAAKVAYVYPYVDATARTGRVRIELANRDLLLRPGMFASVDLAADAESRVQVPTSAVVYTGPRRLVFVDLGEGRLRPQEVRLGSEANGMVEVLDGLRPGDRIATSGVFLIAAEARIGTAAKYWEKTADPPDAGTSLGSAPEAPANPAPPPPEPRAPVRATRAAPPATVWTCVMHPEVRSSKPGKCPKCGMDLVPLAPGGAK